MAIANHFCSPENFLFKPIGSYAYPLNTFYWLVTKIHRTSYVRPHHHTFGLFSVRMCSGVVIAGALNHQYLNKPKKHFRLTIVGSRWPWKLQSRRHQKFLPIGHSHESFIVHWSSLSMSGFQILFPSYLSAGHLLNSKATKPSQAFFFVFFVPAECRRINCHSQIFTFIWIT